MKKKRRLNLGKSKIANMNTLYSIKGGFTVENCATDPCPSETVSFPTDEHTVDYRVCPTLTTRPDTQTCPSGTMSESGTGDTDGGSANILSLNC